MNTAVLLSGGVDSSVVVHQLCEKGHRPTLFYIHIGKDQANDPDCSAEEDIQISKLIARKYNLSFEVIDLHQQYWDKVVSYVIDKARRGLTPNPDVMCNKLIKFGCFEDVAGYQFGKTATGHYATIRTLDNKTWLGTARDPVKDQTDFLSQITNIQLSKLMFPIGALMKEEVRHIATSAKLPSAYRKDSQGICFLGKINYNDLLRRYLGEKEGSLIEQETGKKIGTHKGYWFHTVGQRKGLGLPGGPWYVVDKDINQNIIYISHGNNQSVYKDKFKLHDFHFISGNPGFSAQPAEITFKIRHTSGFIPGQIWLQNNEYVVKSYSGIHGVAPGQFGVIYDKEAQICYGSGELRI